MLGILVHFHDSDHTMYTSPAISAEYGDLIYIALVIKLDVVVVRTETNAPISI